MNVVLSSGTNAALLSVVALVLCASNVAADGPLEAVEDFFSNAVDSIKEFFGGSSSEDSATGNVTSTTTSPSADNPEEAEPPNTERR